MRSILYKFGWYGIALALALITIARPQPSSAQDRDPDDPPSRVARIGYLQASVSFQPAGESEWVGAVPNRPMTTGDQLWADQDSRAEVQLGSAVIRLAPNTGFSFLNLDDDTVQIQLSSGSVNITVRRLGDDDTFEVDTPNQAFTIFRPGHYRVEAGPNGDYTAITVRQGEGEATGGGQSFTVHPGQRATFTGTDRLYADVEQVDRPDDFDNWSDSRDYRHDNSRSAEYLSHDVVGYDDLDDYGDWRDDPNYGHVWYPNRVAYGWAPYHDGHWAWISPWGWTWVDDSPWGYAPFHYGRWVNVRGRWGWIAGPPAVRPVYAPALVVFVGGGPGGAGGNVGWFPLGPREVYVPSYHVSPAYVNRVNVSNTTVNVTQVTNVYNTTIINNTTNVTNVTYVNRNVQGAVMAVPQRSFASAQPVAKASVVMNAREIASAPLSARVAIAPTRESLVGPQPPAANRVAAPPATIANRQVVARKTPPPPPVPFVKQQQALEAHPGQPLARTEVQSLRPAMSPAAARPMVKQAPPAQPATPAMGRPAPPPVQPAFAQPTNRPGNPPPAPRPGTDRPGMDRPGIDRTGTEPNSPPPAAQPNNRPAPPPANRPEMAPNRPEPAPERPPNATQPPPNYRPAPPPPVNRPDTNPNRPEPNAERPPQPAPQPNSRPEPNRPTPPPAAQPNNRPEPARQEPATRPQPQTPPPSAARPATPPPRQQPKPPTPEEKRKQDEKKKQEEKQKPQGA